MLLKTHFTFKFAYAEALPFRMPSVSLIDRN